MKAARMMSVTALAIVGMAALPSARADEFQNHVNSAIAKLDAINKVLDRIAAGSGTQAAAANYSMKCPACGMTMKSVCENASFKAFKIKGKTYYCCTGCNMKPYLDKN